MVLELWEGGVTRKNRAGVGELSTEARDALVLPVNSTLTGDRVSVDCVRLEAPSFRKGVAERVIRIVVV